MSKKKILIVEDEHDMRTLLRLSLVAAGYEVHDACDGHEALEKAGYIVPDLMVLDLMLPRLGGYEVCARLKADSHLNRIPILIFTARATEIDRFMGLQCGADDFLAKPFHEEILLDKIEKLLQGLSNAQVN